MINEITTVYTYALNGANTFLIPFEYLARKFVAVTLIGKDRKLLNINTDYTFLSPNKIVTNKVWTASDGYTLIEIRRYTSANEKLVNFIDGTILRSDDLNTSQIQVLHIAAEARDLSADTIGTNNDGNLDARGRRITNVGNPIDDFDALNLGTVRQWNDSALHSANSASADAERAHNEADRSVIAANSSVAAQAVIVEAERHVKVLEQATATNTATVISSLHKASASATEAANYAMDAKRNSDSSFAHANNAKKEADRAKQEADKLGNWNLLAGTIDSIEAPTDTYNGTVHWRANLHTPEFITERELKLGYHWKTNSNSPCMRFYYGSNSDCGALVVNNNKTLSYTGMNGIIIACATDIDSIRTKHIRTSTGIVIDGGEFHNASESYLISDKRVSYDSGKILRTHGMQLRNGGGNTSQQSWSYLEDNGQRIAHVLNVQNGSTTSNYIFGEQGLEAVTDNITIRHNNKTTILQHDGNLMSTSGLWAGGYLSTHIDTIQQILTNKINEVANNLNNLRNASIINLEFGKDQLINMSDKEPNSYLAPAGNVIVGIFYGTPIKKMSAVWQRTLVITMGNGQQRIVAQQP